ncbi:unnamed protein product [Microthlaspi erraticum]|uniref:Uncharacterized protein n=1 Tax=Microthlaspi erraticum TaxID=1685480 RepID=A0A6D2J6Y3_9BRAS|nr:unnamed protein product [Microthlaspi erraticum]
MTVKDEDPVRTLVKNLGQPSFRLLGFPLALQLLAFQAIPTLLRYLPTTSDDDILLNLPDENFPDNPSLSHLDVINAENHPQLVVQPFIPVDPPAGYIVWGEWAEQEVQDRKVNYLHDLIANNHRFTRAEWPGGATDYELVVHRYVPPRVSHKKHIRNRKKSPLSAKASGSGTRKSARGKEKVEECVNSVAPKGLAEQNKWLVAQVKILKEQQAKLEERTTRLERTRLIKNTGLYRKLSTQRKLSTRKNLTQRTPEPSRTGWEEHPSDHIISLKDGERPVEDWKDTCYDGRTEVGSPNEQPSLFTAAGDAMQQSQFSSSLNQDGGLRGEASTSRGQLFGQPFDGENDEQDKVGEEKRVERGDGEMAVDEEPQREKLLPGEELPTDGNTRVDGPEYTQKVGEDNVTEDVCGQAIVDESAHLEGKQRRDEELPTEGYHRVDETSCTEAVVESVVQDSGPIQPCTQGEGEGDIRTGEADEECG